jgi:DNA-binding transcriptional LysR family regulator
MVSHKFPAALIGFSDCETMTRRKNMELRHLRYLCAIAQYGTFREASRHLHVAQSAISEQIADLEHELGGPLLVRGQRQTRLTPQGRAFVEEAKKTLAQADRAAELARRAMLGQQGSLAIGFFLWGAGSFFASIIRDYRKLHPGVQLSLHEMHHQAQLPALLDGRIDVGFTRPPEPPYDAILQSELLYNDPIVALLPHDHPLAHAPVELAVLAAERFVMCERAVTPVLFDAVLGLCASAGFTPNIVNTSASWPGVLTLVASGEGIALVPAGVHHLRTPGLAFVEVLPRTTHVGLSIAWNPQNEGPVLRDFLRLVRDNKERIRQSA